MEKGIVETTAMEKGIVEKDDFIVPDIVGQHDPHDLTEEERENMLSLIDDISLDITHPVYEPIRMKLSMYLEHGYKDDEIMGELMIDDVKFALFKNRVPVDLWQSYRMRYRKWLGRKRSDAMTKKTVNDFAILQTHDRDFNPKIHIEQEIITPDLTEEERERLKEVFNETTND